MEKKITEKEYVFIIGLNKTATTSINDALAILGYTVLPKSEKYYRKLFMDDVEKQHIIELIKEEDKYEVLSDAPWHIMYKELDINFSNAKFILSKRDEDKWFESVYNYYHTDGKSSLEQIMKHIFGKNSVEYKNSPLIKSKHKNLLIRSYREHQNEVRNYFDGRENTLLEIDVEKESCWPKLCNFLNRNVPNLPFPYANKNELTKLQKTYRQMKKLIKIVLQR